MASGRVARRKLDWLATGPYQRALLRRGVTTKVDTEDERVPVLQQAMEYAGAVGTMVMALGARGYIISGYIVI